MQQTTSLTSHQLDLRMGKMPGSSSSRILYDIPCKVCQDHSSGKHYGIFACDGCAGFFKRSIRRSRQYICKAKSEGMCIVDKTHRNQCRACRLKKCVEAGMNKDAVQHERGPRNSTLRRQMSLYYKEACDTTTDVPYCAPISPILQHPQPHALDLAMPKVSTSTPSSPESSSTQLLQPAAAAALLYLFPKFAPALTMPTPTPTSLLFNSAENVCEIAARLLFMNVQWAKSVPTFTRLNYKDQLLLLEESWRELFLLGAAQFNLPLPLGLAQRLNDYNEIHKKAGKSFSLDHEVKFLQEVKLFQEVLIKFKQLHVDIHEYACLRAIVLFKTSFEQHNAVSSSTSSSSSPTSSTVDSKNLTDIAEVAMVQDHTQLTLSKYIQTTYPEQQSRFGKLLLLLPSLRSVSTNTIEELYFRGTIGNIRIERIICDMYKARD